jgi:spore coat-associated protein N
MSTPTKPPDAPATEAAAEDVGARERLGWLGRNVKLWLGALILLILAIVIAAASGAIFTSSSANPENTFTAGNLSHSNSRPNVAILSATGMVPGDSETGEVTITNTGDVAGRFRLDASGIADTPGPNGGRLSEVLLLKIDDTTTGAPLWEGKFNAMPMQDLGSWPAGEAHKYEFTVTFPEGNQPPSATTGDNAYKGSATKIDFTWTAISE